MYASYVQWVLPEPSSTVQPARKYLFMNKRYITATPTGQILKFTFVPHCLRSERLNLKNNKGFGDVHFAIKVMKCILVFLVSGFYVILLQSLSKQT